MAWSDAARAAALEARRRHAKVLWHVTQTANVPSIQQRGLLTKQPGQWVKAGTGRRYGAGEVYAFEKRADAARWAARMDWEKYKGMGTGKISVVKLKTPIKGWKVDTNDPLSQAGSGGRWLKSKTPVPPSDVRGARPLTVEIVRKLVAGR